MSDTCKKLSAEDLEIQAELDALNKTETDIKARALAKQDAPTDAGFRTFSMVDGTKVRINSMEFWKEFERMAVGQGDEATRAMVRSRFDEGFKPKGSDGLNINYSTLPFDDVNQVALLETIGAMRSETAAGRALMMPFTTEIANSAAEARVAMSGGSVEDIARTMSRNIGGYDKLPVDMVMTQMMRQDSSRHLADMIDDVSDMMASVGVPTQMQAYVARAAQYAQFFEQIDAQLSRKVAQALAARNKAYQNLPLSKRINSKTLKAKLQGKDVSKVDENLLNYGDLRAIGPSTIQPGSLADQIQRAINTGDAKSLKKIAMAKRFDAIQDVKLNQRNFFTEMQMLNAYRKENLFSGTATLFQRATISPLLVGGYNASVDIHKYMYKTKDIGKTFEMTRFAVSNVAKGFGTAWRKNAAEFFQEGKARYTATGSGVIEEVKMSGQSSRKADAYAAANDAWETFFNNVSDVDGNQIPVTAPARALSMLRLFNANSRIFMGWAIENTPKLRDMMGSAGYAPVWATMGASDEGIKKMSYDWTTAVEAMSVAQGKYDDLVAKGQRPELSRGAWTTLEAENITEDTVFNGVMTDEQLNEMRRSMGARQFGDKSNEALRLEMFNNMNGMPDETNPIAAAGVLRGEQNTFTQKLDGFANDVSRLRKMQSEEGLASQIGRAGFGWLTPTFQTPYNGLKWALDNDLYVNIARTLRNETQQAMAKRRAGGLSALSPYAELSQDVVDELPFTPEEMALSRAKATVAVEMAILVNMLHDNGILSDGGPFNRQENYDERQRNKVPPYSLSLGLSYAGMLGNKTGIMELSKLNIPGKSIDFMDAMGSQADMNRARKEGRLSEGQWGQFMKMTAMAYGRLLSDKNTLEGVMSLVQVLTNAPATGGENWIRLLNSQMNGVFPMSGVLRDSSQMLRDPSMTNKDSRRTFTAAEKEYLKMNDGIEFVQSLYQSIFRDIPLLGQFGSRYASDDYYGRKINKPGWLPIDCAQPFAPCLVERGGIDEWLDDNGFGGRPVADGKLSGRYLNTALDIGGKDRFGGATMTFDEEKIFREKMSKTPGDVPVQALLTDANAQIITADNVYDVNSYVKGNTYLEALEALRADPRFNADMQSSGAAPDSPAARDLPLGKQSAAGRRELTDISDDKRAFRSPVDVFNAITDYYVVLGTRGMYSTPEGKAYFERAWATRPKELRKERAIERQEREPLGLFQQ